MVAFGQILAFLGLLVAQVHCALQLASFYNDHMVLQRAPQHAVITGTASTNGDTVTAQITGQGSPVTAKVRNGAWKLKLPAISDPGPFVIEFSSSEGHVTLNDVLFGDVWLCSGQSNMEFTFNNIINASQEEQKALTFKNIRLFEVAKTKNDVAQSTVGSSLRWTVPTTQSFNSFSAVCLLFAEYLQPHINRPIGLVEASWGGTSIGAWSPPEAVAACPKVVHNNPPDCCPQVPLVLWNAMINPILSMTIYGALWYQGETNADHPEAYGCQMIQLVKTWRQRFHDATLGENSLNFPFGYVQLGPLENGTNNSPWGFAPLRWAQSNGHGYSPNSDLPGTFMAVAMDLPDFTSPQGAVHPRYKQDVAERLMLGALNVGYGHTDVAFKGPFPTSIATNRGQQTLSIEYDFGRTPLEIRSDHGFEVCCNTNTQPCDIGGPWVAAPIKSHDSSHVILDISRCAAGRNLIGLRYAWLTSPCALKKCAVYAAESGLPSPIYITDLKPDIVGK